MSSVSHFCRAMMSLGSSKAWPEAVATLTGDRQQGLDTGSLLRYYAPLYLYLRARNEESRACIGWGSELTACTSCTC